MSQKLVTFGTSLSSLKLSLYTAWLLNLPRMASVDFPWSIWATIQKLRIGSIEYIGFLSYLKQRLLSRVMFLKIYGASTASLRKSECSTYNKYASASLLLNSLYLHRLFSKTLIQKHTVHLLRRIAKTIHPCIVLARAKHCYWKPSTYHFMPYLSFYGAGGQTSDKVFRHRKVEN